MRTPGMHEPGRDPPGSGWNNETQHEAEDRRRHSPAPFRNGMCEITPAAPRASPRVPPSPRLFERARPEAGAAGARPRLFRLVVAIGNGVALLDQDGAEIPLADSASRETSSVAVPAVRSAADRPPADQPDQGLAGLLATAIQPAAPPADLVEFGGVETFEPDREIAHPERVAVHHVNRSFEHPAGRPDLEQDTRNQRNGEDKCGKASAAQGWAPMPFVRNLLKQRGSN